MEFTEEVQGRVTILAAKGRLDNAGSASFGDRLQKLAEKSEVRLLIDMSGVSFIASTGLRALMMGLKTAQAANGVLALCDVQRPVREVLDLTGYSTLLRVFPKRAAALSLLSVN